MLYKKSISRSFILVLLALVLFSCSDSSNESVTALNPFSAVETEKEKAPVVQLLQETPTINVKKQRRNTANAPYIPKPDETFHPIPTTLVEQMVSGVQNTPVEETPVEQYLSSLRPSNQIYEVNNDRDTTFVCKNGTILTIPAHSFQDKSGKPVKGMVRFEVKEYSKRSDFVFASLSTATETGEILETGGTLQVNVYEGDQPLTLRKGKGIGMQVPAVNGADEEMRIFYGNHDAHGNVHWNSSKKSKRIITTSQGDYKYYTLTKEIIEVNNNGQAIHNSTDDRTNKYNNKSSKRFWAKYLSGLDIDTLEVILVVDYTGKVKKTTIKRNNKEVKSRVSFYYYKKRSPLSRYTFTKRLRKINWKESQYVGISASKVQDTELKEKYFRKLSKKNKQDVTIRIVQYYGTPFSKKERLANINQNFANKNAGLAKEDVEYYVFNTGKLGWINVDKLYNPEQPKFVFKAKFADSESALVNMVFKNYNAILPGYLKSRSIEFAGVPEDEPVYLVSVKSSNGKTYLCMQETTLSKANNNPVLEYKEVDLTTLKESVQKLNSF